jgi:hypothetical protein
LTGRVLEFSRPAVSHPPGDENDDFRNDVLKTAGNSFPAPGFQPMTKSVPVRGLAGRFFLFLKFNRI